MGIGCCRNADCQFRRGLHEEPAGRQERKVRVFKAEQGQCRTLTGYTVSELLDSFREVQFPELLAAEEGTVAQTDRVNAQLLNPAVRESVHADRGKRIRRIEGAQRGCQLKGIVVDSANAVDKDGILQGSAPGESASACALQRTIADKGFKLLTVLEGTVFNMRHCFRKNHGTEMGPGRHIGDHTRIGIVQTGTECLAADALYGDAVDFARDNHIGQFAGIAYERTGFPVHAEEGRIRRLKRHGDRVRFRVGFALAAERLFRSNAHCTAERGHIFRRGILGQPYAVGILLKKGTLAECVRRNQRDITLNMDFLKMVAPVNRTFTAGTE